MSRRLSRYELLLRLYPATYRERYGQQMVQTLVDMLDDTQTVSERLLVWTRVAVDLPVSLAKSQMQYAGGIMHNETPGYIKRTGILTGVLVLPFFLALIANSLDKVMYDHTLYGSWLWRMPSLGVWVLWLPSTALVLAVVSYATYTFKPRNHDKVSWVQRAFDVVHAWPVMLPGIMAFSILFILAFHDSAHCWVQNPTHFVTKFHQTVQCTQRGFIGG